RGSLRRASARNVARAVRRRGRQRRPGTDARAGRAGVRRRGSRPRAATRRANGRVASRAGFLIAAFALAAPATAAAPVTVVRPSLLHVVDGVVYAGADRLVTGTQPSWSPDGSQFAFVRGDSVWIANADGSGARKLSTGSQPAWKPDGELAYVREGTIVVAGRAAAHGAHPAFARNGRLAYDA